MQYWVVGANWSGENVSDDFYTRGYWEMGYDDSKKPGYVKKRESIKVNDRIAIKRRDGKAAKTITIIALGTVKDVADGKVYIDWVLRDIERKVPCKNYFGTIHGPVKDEKWRNEAFCL